MKKGIKIILEVVFLVLILVLLDSVQAKIFNTRPIIRVKENVDGGLVDYVNKGLLVKNYVCTDGTDKTVFLNKKYDCSDSVKIKEIVDTSKDEKDFACDEMTEEFYDDGSYKYAYSCVKSKYVLVRYKNGFEETVKDALKKGKITIEDLDNYNIEYIKTAKEIDLTCLKSFLGGLITTEKVMPKVEKLKNIISVSLKNVDYSYIEKDKLGIYVIIKTSDTKVINALEKYLDKNNQGYHKYNLNDYTIYVENGFSDLDLEESRSCLK